MATLYPAVAFDKDDGFDRDALINLSGSDSMATGDAANNTQYRISGSHTGISEVEAALIIVAWVTGDEVDVTWRDEHSYRMTFQAKPTRAYLTPGLVNVTVELWGYRL